MKKITKIGICGERIVTNEDEARAAARHHLDWYGYEEGERDPLEVECWDDEDGKWHVRPCYGREVQRSDSFDDVAVFESEAGADAYCAEHNAKAVQDQLDAIEWHELPLPLEYLDFDGCKSGNYPQSRRAYLEAVIGDFATSGADVSVVGYGDAGYISQRHSHAALSNAVDALLEKLKLISTQPWTAWRGKLKLSREDVVTILQAKQNVKAKEEVLAAALAEN